MEVASTWLGEQWGRLLVQAWALVEAEGVGGQVTVLLMVAIGLRLVACAARRPRLSGGLLLTWSGWFVWACYTSRVSLEGMSRRGHKVYTATHSFWLALFELVAAWALFVAPFLTDLLDLAARVWGLLSLERKVQLGALCAFGYMLVQIYRSAVRKLAEGRRAVGRRVSDSRRRIREQKDVALHMLWHASFLGVAAGLWWAVGLLPPARLPTVVWLLISVGPAGLSMLCFQRHATAERALQVSACAGACHGRGYQLGWGLIVMAGALQDALASAGVRSDDEESTSDSDAADDSGVPRSVGARRRAAAARDPTVREATTRAKAASASIKTWLSCVWPVSLAFLGGLLARPH
jgi:hypothetical protein